MPTEPVEFLCAARSDIGLVRRSNQDSGYAGSNLLVLADGMGGPAGGDIASSIAVAHLAGLDVESHSGEDMLPLLRKALVDAHDDLCDRSALSPELQGLGTTCIAVLLSGNRLAMVHIGDSRAYLLRDGRLTQVTTDHSFVQYLVDTGQITPEEAEHHPKRNVVMRVLGDLQSDVTPDETIREAVLGDRWLLCSDGLSGVVSGETIAEVLARVADPGECAEELIHLALLAGGPDNITCVVADIVPTGTAPQRPAQVVGAAAVTRSEPTRGGGGAAARAAALTAQDRAETEEETPRPRVRWWTPLLTLLVLLLVGGGTWGAWAWSQTQWYVIGSEGRVVIHRGIPQNIGPWELSHAVEVTDISLEDLPQVERDRLREPVVRSSREEIDAYVAGLETSARRRATERAAESTQSGDTSQSGAQSGAH